MRCISRVSLTLLLLVFVAGSASADIALFDYGFNLNGTIYSKTTVVPGLNAAGFDTITGLGTLTLTYSPGAAGVYDLRVFFDHEISEGINTYFNEYGSVGGAPAAGQKWEIDEPGYVFGNIWTNFTTGSLDNTNGVPSSAPDDVSMAMGWNLLLAADQSAVATFIIGDTAPGGFYLQQTDPGTGENIFLSSSLTFQSTSVPEPAGALILLLGCAIVLAFFRRLRTA